MNIKEFDVCCGAFIISDFGHTTCTTGSGENHPKKTIEEYLKMCISDYGHTAFLLAILNEEQTKKIGKVLEKAGFMPQSAGWNENHSHVLTLFVRPNTEGLPK